MEEGHRRLKWFLGTVPAVPSYSKNLLLSHAPMASFTATIPSFGLQPLSFHHKLIHGYTWCIIVWYRCIWLNTHARTHTHVYIYIHMCARLCAYVRVLSSYMYWFYIVQRRYTSTVYVHVVPLACILALTLICKHTSVWSCMIIDILMLEDLQLSHTVACSAILDPNGPGHSTSSSCRSSLMLWDSKGVALRLEKELRTAEFLGFF